MGYDDRGVPLAEWAAAHGVALATARRWARVGHLTAWRVGRQWVVDRNEPAPAPPKRPGRPRRVKG